MELPTFRHLIRAVNEDSKGADGATSHSYQIVEFQPNGQFIKRPNIKIADTKMRSDGVKLYEKVEGGRPRLLSYADFRTLKVLWDNLRLEKGWTIVNDRGE